MRIFSAKYWVMIFLFSVLSGPAFLQAEEFCYGRNVVGPDGEVHNPCLQPKCYRGPNGQGEVIKWVGSEGQCRYQSVGQSWGYPGNYKNFIREIWVR